MSFRFKSPIYHTEQIDFIEKKDSIEKSNSLVESDHMKNNSGAMTSGQAPLTARIFNIQRYSLNDGGGIRTTIFFKGCPHRCPWCANPESISIKIEVIKRQSKCLGCTSCTQSPDLCPSGALERVGYDISLDDLLKQILKDEIFFSVSGGGVTLSGGEVLMQAKFAVNLLERLQFLGINTAIETAGDGPTTALLNVAKWCDTVLFDLKIMAPDIAQKNLKMDQVNVLKNFTTLIENGVHVIPRLPLIPGYTFTLENMAQIKQFLMPFHLHEIHLLPYHRLGESKYALLAHDYSLKDVAEPQPKEIESAKHYWTEAGYRVVVGG